MKTTTTKTTLFQRKRICKLFHERQMSRQEIADKFGITVYGVRNILNCHMNEHGEYIQRPEKSLPKSPLTKLKDEVWRDLDISARGRYIISDHGRIKSFVKDKGRLI
jgi:transcriptional regulator with XRE-family HTH domain